MSFYELATLCSIFDLCEASVEASFRVSVWLVPFRRKSWEFFGLQAVENSRKCAWVMSFNGWMSSVCTHYSESLFRFSLLGMKK